MQRPPDPQLPLRRHADDQIPPPDPFRTGCREVLAPGADRVGEVVTQRLSTDPSLNHHALILDKPHRLLFHGKNHFLRSHVGQMAVHDEQGMHYAGDPKAQGQNQIQNGLNRFSTQEHGDGRQNDGEVSSVGFLKTAPDAFSMVSISAIRSPVGVPSSSCASVAA